MVNINFLEQHRKELRKNNVFDQRFYKGSLIVMGVVIVLTMALLAGNFFLQLKVSEVQAREKDLEKAILFQEEVEKSVVVLAKKIEIIRDLLSQRHNKQETIAYFTTILGDEVALKGIDYSEEANVLSLQVEATTIFTLDKFTLFLDSPEVKAKYPAITKSELRRDDDGTYLLTITIALGGEDPKKADKKDAKIPEAEDPTVPK
jgi:hypothetical protein